MARRNGKQHQHEKEAKQASALIQVICAIGLIAIILYSIFKEAPVSTFVYAILGGGILGTDNILKLVKSIFRIGDGNGK